MQRPTIGLIALLLLALGAYFQITGSVENQMVFSSVRIGAVLGALWLAYPQLERLPQWLLGGILVAAVVIAWRPKFVLAALPVAAAIWLLRPRQRRQR